MQSELLTAPIIANAVVIASILLALALLLALYRSLKGPTAADRIVALDLMAGISLSTLVLLAISSDRSLYLNVAVCIALLAFLSTAAFARYLSRKAK